MLLLLFRANKRLFGSHNSYVSYTHTVFSMSHKIRRPKQHIGATRTVANNFHNVQPRNTRTSSLIAWLQPKDYRLSFLIEYTIFKTDDHIFINSHRDNIFFVFGGMTILMESIFRALVKHDMLISKLNHKHQKLFLRFLNDKSRSALFWMQIIFMFQTSRVKCLFLIFMEWSFLRTFQPKAMLDCLQEEQKTGKSTNKSNSYHKIWWL